MLKRIVIALLLLGGLGAGMAYALDFTADMVTIAQGRRMSGKIFVANEKVRMDMAGTSTISRMDKQAVWVLMPGEKLYMEQPFDPERVAGTSEKMPGEVERTVIGPDTFDGKPVIKYRIVYTSRQGNAVVVQWIDTASGIPVRTESEDGSWAMEYRNLKIGAPDPAVFEVPQGYKKFAMPSMDDMMRAAKAQAGGN